MHICIYIQTHTYIHAYIHTYTYIHITHTYINTCTKYIHAYTHTYIHTYIDYIRTCRPQLWAKLYLFEFERKFGLLVCAYERYRTDTEIQRKIFSKREGKAGRKRERGGG